MRGPEWETYKFFHLGKSSSVEWYAGVRSPRNLDLAMLEMRLPSSARLEVLVWQTPVA